MCSRYQLKKGPKTDSLLSALGAEGTPLYSDDVAPGARISIVRESGGRRRVDTAVWWLLLDPRSLKPNYKYASFNSRWDKLDQPRSIAYHPYRESRCIIPASALCEGMGDRKTYHKIELEDSAIAFGGLFRAHAHPETGEEVLSASIITLPPLEKWADIHPKSVPLMLDPENSEMIGRWLNPEFHEVEAFSELLVPAVHRPQRVTPIDRPSRWNPVGESFLIA